MNEPRDDRWSAWIDGELDPQEAQSLEAEFVADPRRRAEAEAFREHVLRLREGLDQAFGQPAEADEGPGLSSRELVASVLAAAEEEPSRSGAAVHSWFAFAGASLAALMLVGIAIWAWDMPLPTEVGRESTDQVAITEDGETSSDVLEKDSGDLDRWAGEAAPAEAQPENERAENQRNGEKSNAAKLLRMRQAAEDEPRLGSGNEVSRSAKPLGAAGETLSSRVSRSAMDDQKEETEVLEQAIEGAESRQPKAATRGGRRGRAPADDRRTEPNGGVVAGGGVASSGTVEERPKTGGPASPGPAGPTSPVPAGPVTPAIVESQGPTGPAPSGPTTPGAVTADPKERRQVLSEKKAAEESLELDEGLQRAVANAEEPVTSGDRAEERENPPPGRNEEGADKPRDLSPISNRLANLGLPTVRFAVGSANLDVDAVSAQLRDALGAEQQDPRRGGATVGQLADGDGVTFVVRGGIAQLAFSVPDLVRTLSDIGTGTDRPDFARAMRFEPVNPVASVDREAARGFSFGGADFAGRPRGAGLGGVGGFVVRIDRVN